MSGATQHGRDLGDGLILRRATAADIEALAAFNAQIFRWSDEDGPNEGMGIWTRDLMRGGHPTVGVDDMTVVEDQESGAIISSLVLISQRWSYGGIPIEVGRPELVGTH